MEERRVNSIPRVLIIDCSESVCARGISYLREAGFRVDTTDTAAEGFTFLEERAVDVVLLDTDLHEADGFDICSQIRSSTHSASIPILLFTPRDNSEAVDKAFRAGATDFSNKPVYWPVLAHQIHNMLRTNVVFEALGQNRRSLDVAQRVARLGSWEYIMGTGELIWSDNLFRLLGREPHEEESSLSLYVKHIEEADRQLFLDWLSSNNNTKQLTSFQHRLVTGDGEERQVKVQIQNEYDSSERITRKWGVVHDVTEQYQAERKIHQLAYYDSLTLLPNRALFCERLAQSLAMAKREPTDIAVLFLDLDNFKRVNDSLGHAYGDLLLQEVGDRLQESASKFNREYSNEDITCTVARMGGDEFTVLLMGLDNRADVEQFAKQLSDSLSNVYELDGNDCHTTPSIGISFFPDHGNSVDDLLKAADIAMYGAKKVGKGCFRTYNQEMDENSIRRYQMEELLRTAIEKNELVLHFQPQMNVETGLLESVEALVRWNSDELGFVSPGDFIPLAESTGLIVPIGEWVLRTACLRAQEWIAAGVPLKRVAVNISVIEFIRPEFVSIVTHIVNESGISPDMVELEITESVLVEDTFSAVDTMQLLKNYGFLLSIDDFGTGFSSLSQLKHFPIDRLKVDQSFVHGMLTNVHDAAIIQAVLTMANKMNLKVIAEGVETCEQLDFLDKIHCDEAQGYLLSRPVPAEAIPEVFADFNCPKLKLTGTDH